MDHPSIIKILEDDEADEIQYSGAEVDAFTAELNRDIEADAAPPSDSDSGKLTHASSETSILNQIQASNQEEGSSNQGQHEKTALYSDGKEQHSSEIEPKTEVSAIKKQEQQEVNRSGQILPVTQQSQSLGDQNIALAFDKNQVQIAGANSAHSAGPTGNFEVSGSQQQPPPIAVSTNKQHNLQGDQANMARRNKTTGSIPFALLMPILCPQLDKDKVMQLQAFYDQLKKNEITKDHFLRVVRHVVGDQMLKMAVQTAHMQQARIQAARGAQYQALPQSSAQQPPSSTAPQSQQSTSSVQVKIEPSSQTQETGAQKVREGGTPSEAQGLQMNPVSVKPERDLPMTSLQPVNKPQQLQKHHFHPSYAMYGGPVVGNYNPHQFAGPSAASGSTSRPQTQDPQLRQVSQLQSMVPSQVGSLQPMNSTAVPKYEPDNVTMHSDSIANHASMHSNTNSWPPPLNKESKTANMTPLAYPKQEPVDKVSEHQPRAPHLPSIPRPPSTFTTSHTIQGNLASTSSNPDLLDRQANRLGYIPNIPNHIPPDGQHDISMQMSSATSQVTSGLNAKIPQKKPAVGQKKPHESPETPSLPNKKQKVAGGNVDQSIDQLNDVTAVSGVNLREEEEQLLAAPKDENRASEATRKVAQAEEEKLILQKTPLRKKIAEIMNKHGIRASSNDVERCLSLSVEERMRGLITKMIRVSKQRVDLEKPRHGRNVVVTSDVRRQILMVNRKFKEEWDKKQAKEAEKQRKLNEVEGSTGEDSEKDETRTKAPKGNKEEDDKMRTTAANVAARAAVGGDDMLSKWQLMAEQARQKREGGGDASISGPQISREVGHKPMSASGKPLRGDAQDLESKGLYPSASGGTVRKFGRSSLPTPSPKIIRTICVKDVIAVLERELQMSKSNLIYRLYEKRRSNSTTE